MSLPLLAVAVIKHNGAAMGIKDLEREIELLKEKVRLMERVKELEAQPSLAVYPSYPWWAQEPTTIISYDGSQIDYIGFG